jgi:hypothetical protein
MKPLSITILVIAGFAAGLFFGQSGTREKAVEAKEPVLSTPTPTVASCAELEKFKSDLKGISPEEIRQYLKTQDADQKLRKADEILGKIMQLLVAQVGYRLQNEDLHQFGKIPEKIDTQPAPAAKEASVTKPSPVSAPPRRPLFRVNNVQSEEQARIALRELGADYSTRLQQAGRLSPQQVQDLNGSFEGTMVLDRDQKVNRVQMTFNAELTQNSLRGDWSLEMFDENQKSRGRSRGRGDLSRDFTGDANEVFIEFNRSYYFQLVYFPKLDQWIGNYLDGERGVYRKIGSAILRRR